MRWLWFFILGCRAHSPAVTVHEATERYQARITGEFGPVIVQTTGEVLQPPMRVLAELQLRLVPSRHFRDGSYGRLIHMDTAKFTRLDGQEYEVLDNELSGRTVELRTFPDGEILDISWGEKVAGQGRFLDVFEIVFPVVSPAAPSIPDGESMKRSIIWPFRQGKDLRWDNTIEATWLNEGMVAVNDVEAWSLSYDGAWSTEGATRKVSPQRKWESDGMAEGVVMFEHNSSDMVQHRFDWSRTVSVVGVGGAISQVQRFVGEMERLK